MFPESEKLLILEKELCLKLSSLNFKPQVEYIYNPLIYAEDLHVKFYQKYFENSTKQILFLAMNPGPWGMCQTGIVFGERYYVTEWLKITGTVEKPVEEHPKKKITGLQCHRSEISGKKFWGFFKTLCDIPENFFKHSFIYNYCPLAFVAGSGKNITPPEIKDAHTQKLLSNICDDILIKIIKTFHVKLVIGIGKYAEKCALKALKSNQITNIKTKLNLLKEMMLNDASEENEKTRIQKWMKISLGFAEKALENGEVPVGCIFIYNNEIIARGSNTVNETKNATRHAEMNCIDDVLTWCKAKSLNHQQVFREVEVVVTVEPCIMCSAALHELNIKQIVYGCFNYRFGGCSTVFDVPGIYNNSTCKVQAAVYADEAIDLLKKFYQGTNPNAPKSKVKIKKSKEAITL